MRVRVYVCVWHTFGLATWETKMQTWIEGGLQQQSHTHSHTYLHIFNYKCATCQHISYQWFATQLPARKHPEKWTNSRWARPASKCQAAELSSSKLQCKCHKSHNSSHRGLSVSRYSMQIFHIIKLQQKCKTHFQLHTERQKPMTGKI